MGVVAPGEKKPVGFKRSTIEEQCPAISKEKQNL